MQKKAPKNLRLAERGLTHAYIGDGKGKTTAAIGTAVRARGYGWNVAFIQFIKEEKWPSGERGMLRKLGIEVHVLGQGFYKIINDRKPAAAHKTAAKKALQFAQALVRSGTFQLVVLDEVGSAVEEGLLPRAPVEAMLRARARDARAKHVHLIWTGHKRIPWMLKYADLVTDMRMVKHPYYRGIIATKGLDY